MSEAPDRNTLLALAKRVEAADPAYQGQLIEDAWKLIAPTWRIDRALLAEKARCFGLFLDARAYIDAAMMLVREGWMLRQMNFSAPCADDRKWHLNLHGGKHGEDRFVGRGRTPALALTAAALRALAERN